MGARGMADQDCVSVGLHWLAGIVRLPGARLLWIEDEWYVDLLDSGSCWS